MNKARINHVYRTLTAGQDSLIDILNKTYAKKRGLEAPEFKVPHSQVIDALNEAHRQLEYNK